MSAPRSSAQSSANIGFNPRLFLLESLLHLLDGVLLGGFGDVDVGFHGFVVGVAGPFHDYLGRDAAGEGETDEGASAGMGADFGVFGINVTNILFFKFIILYRSYPRHYF